MTLPFVSICTPTFNRRPFFPAFIRCISLQTYPASRLEWLIADDGTDPINDLIQDAQNNGLIHSDVTVRYFRCLPDLPERPLPWTLGRKRNFLNQHATGDFIVFMDDDDFQQPSRISSSVQSLLDHPDFLIAGSSAMFVYFSDSSQLFLCGPFPPPFHATEATWTFHRNLLQLTRFDDTSILAEGSSFLKNYTIPLFQLDPLSTIVVCHHLHNSLDRSLLRHDSTMWHDVSSTVNLHSLIVDHDSFSWYIDGIDSSLLLYLAGETKFKPQLLGATHLVNQLCRLREHYESIIVEKNNIISDMERKLSIQTSLISSIRKHS